MVTVANLVETAIDSLRDIVSGKPSTNQSSPHLEAMMLTQAIKAIERDEGFSDNELMDTVLAIENQNTWRHISALKVKAHILYIVPSPSHG